ncbi:sensor histidine kinase [Variovorax sp. M-6]|uniref:sensor histidine kinase n=1 Tax=Variovorax sp. M-6 TaxID=3233041 RepID=UPI003F995D17
MSWVTIVWAMVGSACLMLAAVHLPVWVKDRAAWPSLFFSILAAATAALAFCELVAMKTQGPDEYALAHRTGHVAVWLVTVSLVGFVRSYLKCGRAWLGWTVVVLRTFTLFPNFLSGRSLNFKEISALRAIPFLGENVSVAIGTPNPWMLVGQLAMGLLTIFVLDASHSAWRRGNRAAALTIGGTACFFALGGVAQAILVFWGFVEAPIMVSLFSLGIVFAMAYELSRNVRHAARLLHALRESEERMTLATQAANLGLWVRDVASGIFWASSRTRQLFGFSSSEQINFESLLMKVHADDRDMVRLAFSEAAGGDRAGRYQMEFRVGGSDGRTRWLSAQGQFEFERQRAVRSRGVCSDITQRKEAEQEMLRLRDEIAHAGRVSVMGQLAASLAHELNQPLGAILRNAEAADLMLQSGHADLEEIRAIVDDILADDQRAGLVIDRMRAMLRRHEVEVMPLDVRDLLENVAALVRPDAAARHIRVELEVAHQLPPVLGDRIHLQQVLLNLISNGMDAIDEAAHKVRSIVVTAMRRGTETVEIAVNDTGSGIPKDRFEQIFGSFFTTKPTGMGMGLSISRTLVEAHGGRLWAENVEGGGASLRVTLPVSPTEGPAMAEPAPEPAARQVRYAA